MNTHKPLELRLRTRGRIMVSMWGPSAPFVWTMLPTGQRKQKPHSFALKLCWDCRNPFTDGKTEGLEAYVPRPDVLAVEINRLYALNLVLEVLVNT